MSKRRYYNFDSFRVDPTERVLLRDGRPISLSPKVFDTLLALVERSGHIVSKDQLFEIVWPDVFVEENNLTQYVAAARRALATVGISVSPNTYVVGFDAGRDEVLAHQLAPDVDGLERSLGFFSATAIWNSRGVGVVTSMSRYAPSSLFTAAIMPAAVESTAGGAVLGIHAVSWWVLKGRLN